MSRHTNPKSKGPAALARNLLQSRYAGALISLLLVSAFLSVYQPVFLTWPNLMNIVKSNSVGFILALGATFVVISGTVDLSFGSATTASAMVFGLLLVAGGAFATGDARRDFGGRSSGSDQRVSCRLCENFVLRGHAGVAIRVSKRGAGGE